MMYLFLIWNLMVGMKKVFIFSLSIVNTVNIFCWLIDVNALLPCLFLTVSMLFFKLKKMSSKEISDDDIVDSNTLFEIAIDVFYLSKHRNAENDFDRNKNRYFHRLWDFIVKFKRKNTLKCLIKRFLILSRYTCFVSLEKIIFLKVNFCSTMEFTLIGSGWLVPICRNVETTSILSWLKI